MAYRVTDVDYVRRSIDMIDENSIVLTSYWKANKAASAISSKWWVMQRNARAKWREDDFAEQWCFLKSEGKTADLADKKYVLNSAPDKA